MRHFLIRSTQDGADLFWNGTRWDDERNTAIRYTDIAQLLEGMRRAGAPWEVVQVEDDEETIVFTFPRAS